MRASKRASSFLPTLAAAVIVAVVAAGGSYLRGQTTPQSFIVDNGTPTGPNYEDGGTTAWLSIAYASAFNGNSRYHKTQDTTAIAKWTFPNATAGRYKVQATWWAHPLFATAAAYRINGRQGVVVVDQTKPATGETYEGKVFQLLAEVEATGPITVELLAHESLPRSISRYVNADAIRIERLSGGGGGTGGGGGGGGETIVKDDGDPGFGVTGTWALQSVYERAFRRDMTFHRPGPSQDRANYDFQNIEPGEYIILTTWPAFSSLSTSVRYEALSMLRDLGGLEDPTLLADWNVNQKREPVGVISEGRPWQTLGKVSIGEGEDLRISVLASGGGYVVADGVTIMRTGEDTVCGDGIEQGEEQCDDGNPGSQDGCSAECRFEYCGDRVKQEEMGETCDDGNGKYGDGCSPNCALEFCGDGVISRNEECDHGELNGTPGSDCSDECKIWYCGDTFVQEELGEQCDDGNVTRGDGCTNICRLARCKNQADDDLDGKVDMQDPGCRFPNDEDETDIAASTSLRVDTDGPVSQIYTRDSNDAVLSNIILRGEGEAIDLRSIFIAIEGKTATNTGLGEGANISTLIEDVEMRNKTSGQTIDGVRLTTTGDFATNATKTYQIYRFDGLPVSGETVWEFRGDFIDNPAALHPASGDKFRVHICGEPTHVMSNGSLRPNTTGCHFGELITSATKYQMRVEEAASHDLVGEVLPRGNLAGNFQSIGAAELSVAVKSIGSTDIVVENQKNVNLLRFEARAGETEDVLLTRVVFDAEEGALVNAQNYMLWVDTDGNGSVDTMLQDGVAAQNEKITLNQLTGGGYVIPAEDTVIFEVHADISSSPTNDKLLLKFATQADNFFEAEELDTGALLQGVRVNAAPCPIAACAITLITQRSQLYTIVNQGDLYVTKDSSPLRPRQMLGGTLSDGLLRLQFHAENEAVDVTDIQITATAAQSIDRLELYKEGEATPFALATVGGCASDPVPAGGTTFCANMENRQLVIPEGSDVDAIVRARMKTDVGGAISGEAIRLFVAGVNNAPQNTGTIRARGDVSSNELSNNDGDANAEGEVFVGAATAGISTFIVGSDNVSVLAKIVSITNANPDANGTAVPSGVRAIGQFKITAAAHQNSKNGLNDVVLENLIFDISAPNVEMKTSDFAFYNKANATVKLDCTVLDGSGNPVTDETVTGTLYARCEGMRSAVVSTEIDQGADETFVLEANIVNPDISGPQTSGLQVRLSAFSGPATQFGASASHFQWIDADTDSQNHFWVEYPETYIHSTQYQS